MNSFSAQIKGKNVLVFGLGLQGGGVGDAIWLHNHGATVRVTDLKTASALSDSLAKLPAEISLSLGNHLQEDIEWADLIIKNPGVPNDQAQLLYAQKLKKPIYTSIALVVQEARDKTIGITGTRGKSTTTELIYTMLDSLYKGEILKGGNLAGSSPLSLLDDLAKAKYLVLELSSFQLSGFHSLRVSPRYAIFTNIYPDHLNRYPNMEAYTHDKAAIFAYQKPGDYLFVNADNKDSLALTANSISTRQLFSAKDAPSDWKTHLTGSHNHENIAAVISLSNVLGISLSDVKKAVSNFHTLPFRLELVRELGGVKYYNDTTSTTPTATIKAVQAFSSPLILILGGDDKHLPTNELVKVLKDLPSLKHIVLLGGKHIPSFVAELKQACGELVQPAVYSMFEAVKIAHSLAKNGDMVLLSPGFASFDLFENEFDRGRQFNQEVSKLTT